MCTACYGRCATVVRRRVGTTDPGCAVSGRDMAVEEFVTELADLEAAAKRLFEDLEAL
jgi:hypothetical protein